MTSEADGSAWLTQTATSSAASPSESTGAVSVPGAGALTRGGRKPFGPPGGPKAPAARATTTAKRRRALRPSPRRRRAPASVQAARTDWRGGLRPSSPPGRRGRRRRFRHHRVEAGAEALGRQVRSDENGALRRSAGPASPPGTRPTSRMLCAAGGTASGRGRLPEVEDEDVDAVRARDRGTKLGALPDDDEPGVPQGGREPPAENRDWGRRARCVPPVAGESSPWLLIEPSDPAAVPEVAGQLCGCDPQGPFDSSGNLSGARIQYFGWPNSERRLGTGSSTAVGAAAVSRATAWPAPGRGPERRRRAAAGRCCGSRPAAGAGSCRGEPVAGLDVVADVDAGDAGRLASHDAADGRDGRQPFVDPGLGVAGGHHRAAVGREAHHRDPVGLGQLADEVRDC